MADRSTIARPYAKAAFRQAQADSQLDGWSTLLDRAAAGVTDTRVALLLGNPRVTPTQLAELVTAVAGDNLSDQQKNFLRMLADNRRLRILPDIARLFQAMKDDAEGTVDVTVTSAAAMQDAEREQIAAALAKRFGRKVRVHTEVDPSLIGGAVLRAGDMVIDGSIKSRLERMAFELTA
ncbi:MAG: F0F1 ATP synthase subunit delta [Steroidobacteraceae bacterium]